MFTVVFFKEPPMRNLLLLKLPISKNKLKSPKKFNKNEFGFSLLEIIIVLGILGTLVAVLIGGLAGSSEKAKVKSTAIKAGQIAQNLLKFNSDTGRYPTTAEGLSSLVTNPGISKWAGPYGEESDTKDDWGSTFEYELSPKGPKVTSHGIDTQPGTADDLVYIGGKQVETAPAEGNNANETPK
jgi:general secretion pathway protein G